MFTLVAMALQVAHISEFDVDNDDIVEYCERFDCYLVANKIEGRTLGNQLLSPVLVVKLINF